MGEFLKVVAGASILVVLATILYVASASFVGFWLYIAMKCAGI